MYKNLFKEDSKVLENILTNHKDALLDFLSPTNADMGISLTSINRFENMQELLKNPEVEMAFKKHGVDLKQVLEEKFIKPEQERQEKMDEVLERCKQIDMKNLTPEDKSFLEKTFSHEWHIKALVKDETRKEEFINLIKQVPDLDKLINKNQELKEYLEKEKINLQEMKTDKKIDLNPNSSEIPKKLDEKLKDVDLESSQTITNDYKNDGVKNKNLDL